MEWNRNRNVLKTHTNESHTTKKKQKKTRYDTRHMYRVWVLVSSSEWIYVKQYSNNNVARDVKLFLLRKPIENNI